MGGRCAATTMMELQIQLKAAAEHIKTFAPESISLSAGCELFMRYVTRSNTEIPDFEACKESLVARSAHYKEMTRTSRNQVSGHCQLERSASFSALTRGEFRGGADRCAGGKVCPRRFGERSCDSDAWPVFACVSASQQKRHRLLTDQPLSARQVVLLHGYSRVVIGLLKSCADKRKRLRCIVTEGTPESHGCAMPTPARFCSSVHGCSAPRMFRAAAATRSRRSCSRSG